ncbi:MAG: DNA-deoxyinosine glycosylase [Eubacterium sp.]|nr:DNA-deoxyinosine glycosylase [Eubacterium sp.]
MEKIRHPIPPVFDGNSKILILGSFPSVKSREEGFFYGHPQNRFWRVLGAVFDDTVPQSIEEKKAFLLKHNVALWDVIKECEITGSADSSIKNAVPNDICKILENSKISRIFTNGKTADRLYGEYLESKTGIRAVCLPSTSPANAVWTLEKLVKKWKNELLCGCDI